MASSKNGTVKSSAVKMAQVIMAPVIWHKWQSR